MPDQPSGEFKTFRVVLLFSTEGRKQLHRLLHIQFFILDLTTVLFDAQDGKQPNRPSLTRE